MALLRNRFHLGQNVICHVSDDDKRYGQITAVLHVGRKYYVAYDKEIQGKTGDYYEEEMLELQTGQAPE